jgi:hypothetical protein
MMFVVDYHIKQKKKKKSLLYTTWPTNMSRTVIGGTTSEY